MQLRLIPERDSDETIHVIIAMNDTRSDMLSLFQTDLACLGNMQGYMGWSGVQATIDGSGEMQLYPQIYVQIQFARDDGTT